MSGTAFGGLLVIKRQKSAMGTSGPGYELPRNEWSSERIVQLPNAECNEMILVNVKAVIKQFKLCLTTHQLISMSM